MASHSARKTESESEACLGLIAGSAFKPEMLPGANLVEDTFDTPFGRWTLFETALEGAETGQRRLLLSFRHGYPHTYLPNQIPYRAQAHALHQAGCEALLVTSSVGVLDLDLPLYRPLIVRDVLTLDNRLPDGSACTMFVDPQPDHGHLVLSEGLISKKLTDQMTDILSKDDEQVLNDVVFGYVGGPRTKTRAENVMWQRLGAQVNSMTVGPELILANELEIACCAVVVGHKYSSAEREAPGDAKTLTGTFEASRDALERIVHGFTERITPVPFGNHVYRYQRSARD